MIPCIYDQSATTFETLGIGPLMNTISCNVVESLNGAFELNMQISKSDKYFKDIHVGSIIVAKPNMTENNQAFVVESISKDIDGVVEIYATHIAQHRAKLIPILPFTANSLANTLTQLVSNAQEINPFTIETDMTSTATFKQVIPHSMRELFGGVEGSIIDVYGGEYSYDNFKITLNRRRGSDNGVRVMYGVNMTEYLQQDSFSWTQSITGVLPFWYSETDGYVKGTIQRTTNADSFPYKKTITLDCSNDFQEKPTPTQLNDFARSWLNGKGNTAINIETSFEMLSQDARFNRLYENIDFVRLGDTVHIVNSEYDVSYESRIIESNFDVLLERYNSLTIGDKQSTINDAIGDTISNALSNVDVLSSNVSYSNISSGLNANTVQSAIDEIDSKLDVIGRTYSKGFTNLTLPNGSYTSATVLENIPKGVYLVITLFQFGGGANGVRRTITYANSATMPSFTRYNGATMQPLSNGVSMLQYTRVLSLNEESNSIGLGGYQSNGSDMANCNGMIYATRIA